VRFFGLRSANVHSGRNSHDLGSSTKDIRDRYGSVAAARRKGQEDTTVETQLDENTRLKKNRDGPLRES
jgi:hypothetical protein